MSPSDIKDLIIVMSPNRVYEKRKLLITFAISILVTCALILTPPGIMILVLSFENIFGFIVGLGVFGMVFAISYVIVSIFSGPRPNP